MRNKNVLGFLKATVQLPDNFPKTFVWKYQQSRLNFRSVENCHMSNRTDNLASNDCKNSNKEILLKPSASILSPWTLVKECPMTFDSATSL
jgi:hypothetical protein